MSFNYSSLADTSTRLIDRFGSNVTLHLTVIDGNGPFNPVTGTGGDTEEDETVKAVKLNFSSRDIDETLIKTGDFMLLIDGIFELSKDDKVTVDGVKYAILRPMPLKPGDTRLLTKAHCRR